MSAGPFNTTAVYEMDNGMFTTLTVQPETLQFSVSGTANAEATGALTVGIPSAKFSKNAGEIGLKPRCITGKWLTVAAGTEYTVGGRVTLPILTAALASTFVKGAVADYLGGTVEITRAFPENVV